MRDHLRTGIVQRLDLTTRVHLEAERLLLAAQDVPLRANDALHVALASLSDMVTVVTYDPRLARSASVAGLTAVMPGVAVE